MEVLYRGFDGLDVSLIGKISDRLCEELEAAKGHAQQSHGPCVLVFNDVKLLVFESGARGGYSFLASTGDFGATWFFKKPNARDPWGVRISCNSFNLALNGLGQVRSELYRTLDLLGVTLAVQGERIGRVDYAVDVLAQDFVLFPEHFVMHSNAGRAEHIEHPEITCNGRSGRVTSVTVGKMPGRQVIVYDKRAEVIAKHKVGWWEIWNAARARGGLLPLNRNTPEESRVWRVELRAGKQHLKDRWNIRTWADLDNRLGDMIAATLDAIRHTRPTGDSNRSRWPDSELWEHVRAQVADDLFELRNYADPDLVKHVQQEAHDRLLASQMTGLLITRAALRGTKASDLPSFAIATGEQMARDITIAASRFESKLANAIDRYSLGPGGQSSAAGSGRRN